MHSRSVPTCPGGSKSRDLSWVVRSTFFVGSDPLAIADPKSPKPTPAECAVSTVLFSFPYRRYYFLVGTRGSFSNVNFTGGGLSCCAASTMLPTARPLSNAPNFPRYALYHFLQYLSRGLAFLCATSVHASSRSGRLRPSVKRFTNVYSSQRVTIPPNSLRGRPLNAYGLLHRSV